MMLCSKRRIKDTDSRWFINKEGNIKRNAIGSITLIKGYLVAPLEDLNNDFWVTEEQLHERFEEAV